MWTKIAELHVWCESAQLMAEWNIQYNKYSIIYNAMYHIIMSSDVRNGRIFSVRMSHHDTVSGLLESTSESSRFIHGYPSPSGHNWGHRTPDTYKIHITQSQLPDNIRGNEDGILYQVTEEFITFLHTPQSTLIHSFIKPPRYIQHNGMLKYSTVHRMRCNVEQYCMVQHISQKFYTRVT